MKRDKAFWGRLDKFERSELIWLERDAKHSGHSNMIPDDCVECGHCSTPHSGTGLCPLCDRRLNQILDKGYEMPF